MLMQEVSSIDKRKRKVLQGRVKQKNVHRNHKLMVVNPEARKATKMFLNPEASRQLENSCGTKAAWLHTKYVDFAEEYHRELTDEFMAHLLGWSTRAIQKYRLILEKSFWFRKISVERKTENNTYGVTYYLLDYETNLKELTDDEYVEAYARK